MHRETKATAIPTAVKALVAERDCTNGPATCIVCGRPGFPHCHIVRRSQGGKGVVENIVSLCNECHYAFDEGIGLKRLEPLGFRSRQDIEDFIIDYIKSFYPDWTREKVIYHKWNEQEESEPC